MSASESVSPACARPSTRPRPGSGRKPGAARSPGIALSGASARPGDQSSVRASPSASAADSTAGRRPGSTQASASRTYFGWIDSRSTRILPARAVSSASRSRCGHGASGFTWFRRHRGDAAPVVDPGGDQPGRVLAGKVRRRLDRHFRAEDQPRGRDGPLEVRQVRLRRVRHAGARLGAEVLTMTSWMWPNSSCRSRIASSVSIRSARVSPMPISRPVVNGTFWRPASAIVSSRAAGSLSGEPWWHALSPAAGARRSPP